MWLLRSAVHRFSVGLWRAAGEYGPYLLPRMEPRRTDEPEIQVSGTTESISIACENRLIEMNTSATQFRYIQECQAIFYPNDLAFSAVNSIANQSQLYWGRIPNNQNLGVGTNGL